MLICSKFIHSELFGMMVNDIKCNIHFTLLCAMFSKSRIYSWELLTEAVHGPTTLVKKCFLYIKESNIKEFQKVSKYIE